MFAFANVLIVNNCMLFSRVTLWRSIMFKYLVTWNWIKKHPISYSQLNVVFKCCRDSARRVRLTPSYSNLYMNRKIHLSKVFNLFKKKLCFNTGSLCCYEYMNYIQLSLFYTVSTIYFLYFQFWLKFIATKHFMFFNVFYLD